jgi:hypothetical protein
MSLAGDPRGVERERDSAAEKLQGKIETDISK